MTVWEVIWRLAKDADAIRPELYIAIVECIGVDAFAANQWEQAEDLMQAYWVMHD
jgi:hypothetical protein